MKSFFKLHIALCTSTLNNSVFLLFFCLSFSHSVAQQLKKTVTGRVVYYEQDGKFIFPGNQVIIDSGLVGRVMQGDKNEQLVFANTSAPSKSFRASSANSAIVLNITPSNPTCGYGSGSIVVEAANGVLPYTYFLTDAYNYTRQQLTGNFPILGAGTYSVKVKDANGDSTVTTVTLANNDPGPVLVGFTGIPVKPTGCATTDGSIVLNAWGGTPPYTYSLDLVNFQTSNVFNNLYPGIYTFYAKDAKGCIGSFTALGILSSQNFNCYDNGMSGSFGGVTCGTNSNPVITIRGPYGPYEYSMDGVNYQTTGQFNNVGVGVHKFYIKKANGQVIIYAFNVAQFCEVSIDYVSVAAACLGNNGTLEVTASNGKPPYAYSIDGINFQTGNLFTNLAPGNYSITVRDDNGIKSSLPATVFDKCPIVRVTTSSETCAGNDGTITAGGFRGTEPYQYSLDGINFQTGTTFTGLTAGTYTVTIKDDLGFMGTVSATVLYNCLQVNVTGTNTTCGLNNGMITAIASNGTAPYSYSLDGINFQSGNTFNNLSQGNYTITIKDGTGATATRSAIISATAVPVLNIDTTGATCFGNDGIVRLSVNGGVAPFVYSFDGINYGANTVLNNVRADSIITAFVKDSNNCISSASFKVSLHCPSVTIVTKAEVCEQQDGVIRINVVGNYAPYLYSLDGINFQTNNIYTNLPDGKYKLYIQDRLGIVNSYDAEIRNSCVQASVDVVNETCSYANGKITVTATNGTYPYEYSLNNGPFQNSNVFSNLTASNYTITVRDSLQTIFSMPVNIQNLPGPALMVNTFAASCSNNNGRIELAAQEGIAPYTYSLDNVNFTTSSVFNNLSSGSYRVYVKDAQGCISNRDTVVALVSDLTILVPDSFTICEGSQVQITASSNADQFRWQPSVNISNPGILQPTVNPVVSTMLKLTASKGVCTVIDSTFILVNPAPVAIASSDTTICYGQDVQLKASGGIMFYWNPITYLDNPGSPNPLVKSPPSTVKYNLKVTDQNGCASLNNVAVTVTVKPPPVLFAGKDTSAAKGEAVQLFATDLNNTGFTRYTWWPVTGLNSSNVQNPVAINNNSIVYYVNAVTDEGCKASDTIKITVFDKPEIFVPTAFSPNSDGLNDYLKPVPVGIKQFNYFRVYNRWGQLVFSGKDFNAGWNGVFKSEEQPLGIYTWVVSGTDFKGNVIRKTGNVTLMR